MAARSWCLSTAVNSNNVEAVFKTLSNLHQSGQAILMIGQDARRTLRHAERAYVMETGRIVLADTAAVVAGDSRVIESYVG